MVPAAERRVCGLRFDRLLRALVALGCEVRQGKGSEVNVYRRGGRIARVGHHHGNRALSPRHVRVVLDLLDLPVADLLAALA
ncbi:MAG: hypothetical protein JWM10_2725 [Myxococcaceae bacterium]|nr:hypothetical protein [Myxococcaceae bacterium]